MEANKRKCDRELIYNTTFKNTQEKKIEYGQFRSH